MLFFITILFACQLLGEAIAAAAQLPIPGPVIGMIILLVGLLINKGIPEELGHIADALLSNLTLLFVPAGVGIMIHAHLIVTDILPIALSIVLSTILTIIVTGALMSWLNQKPRKLFPGSKSPENSGESQS